MKTANTSDDKSITAATDPKSIGNGIVLKNPAVQPASLFPTAPERNHTPIINPRIRAGASLVTTLSPTGLRLNSPTSSIKYAHTSHHGLTRIPGPACALAPAGTRSRNAKPANRRPIANLVGLDGSLLPSRIQSQAITGASRM